MRFTMPIPPKSIPDQKGIFVAHRTAVHGSRQNEFWPALAQGHSSQIFVCHRRYPSLTQNAKPTSSNVFHHADSTQVDSRSKWTLFCAPRHARAWTTSVLATPWPFQPNMGMSPGLPQFDPECQTHLFQRFSPCQFHPNPFPVKMEFFFAHRTTCALGQHQFWPFHGHFSQISICYRGYPSLTQNVKPNFSYVFHHADSTQIDSQSKWKFFLRAVPHTPGLNQFQPSEASTIPTKYGCVTGDAPV